MRHFSSLYPYSYHHFPGKSDKKPNFSNFSKVSLESNFICQSNVILMERDDSVLYHTFLWIPFFAFSLTEKTFLLHTNFRQSLGLRLEQLHTKLLTSFKSPNVVLLKTRISKEWLQFYITQTFKKGHRFYFIKWQSKFHGCINSF